MAEQLIITKWKNRILTMLCADRKPISLNLETGKDGSILHNIYIGKIVNLVKNIDAAFVDVGGVMGYYSLSGNPCHHLARPSERSMNGTWKLRPGDEIIVQVERDRVKTKYPVFSGNLNFTGRYCVLTSGKSQIGFSAKIHDTDWKKRIRATVDAVKGEDYGVIIRTNAVHAPIAVIMEELKKLEDQYRELIDNAACRTCFSLLFKAVPSHVANIRDSYEDGLEVILTDEKSIYEDVFRYLNQNQSADLEKLRFYQDDLLPLSKLYSIETIMENVLSKRVWLKSGGYLVIEPTEALVVIDVNTGKYAGKKNAKDTIRKINLEAAAEISRQLRLRNLSGIIIVDFIDMDQEEDKEFLKAAMEKLVAFDPIKTTVVGISQLNLMEITRKKVRRPLYEQVRESDPTQIGQ